MLINKAVCPPCPALPCAQNAGMRPAARGRASRSARWRLGMVRIEGWHAACKPVALFIRTTLAGFRDSLLNRGARLDRAGGA